MKPKMQGLVNPEKGDCMGSCVASILELDLIPNFHTDESGDWMTKWNDFLESYNLQIIYLPGGVPPPRGYAIMVINSVNFPGKTHAVVWKGEGGWLDGKVVHDPSPLKHPEEYNPVGWYVLAARDPVLFLKR